MFARMELSVVVPVHDEAPNIPLLVAELCQALDGLVDAELIVVNDGSEDDTLALRVVKDQFCQQLLRKLRRPLVSTSANISGEKTPESFAQIAPEILKGVDYVVNLHRTRNTTKPSAIIKLSNSGIVKGIRK